MFKAGGKLPGPVYARSPVEKTRRVGIKSLTGEEISYNLSLLYFFNVAESKLSLTRNGKGQLEANFFARTKGLANWVLTPRKHYLRTVFKESGGRLRPLFHENRIIKGDKQKTSRYRFDYQQKILVRKVAVGNRRPRKKIFPFPETGEFNDVLSVFYNLRSYYELTPGKKFNLYGLPGKKKSSVYHLIILTEKEKKKNSFWSDRPREARTLIRAVIDSDVFGTKKGLFWFFFDRKMVPIYGVAEDAVARGDIKGVMTSRKRGG
ncbi:MAG: DUF3108 domain-containing protein [bacterium]